MNTFDARAVRAGQKSAGAARCIAAIEPDAAALYGLPMLPAAPLSPEALLDRLATIGIPVVTHRHPALFTVEDSKRLRGDLPGGHCKNLLLKDKKDRVTLLVALEDSAIDLKSLARELGGGRLTFARAELLFGLLGVTPGAVSPFGLVHAPPGALKVILERRMLDCDPLNFHPLTNEATCAIAPTDLLRFLRACGHEPEIRALPLGEPRARQGLPGGAQDAI
jgi:Ala-tRNA(Pro) deacylase